MASPQSGGDLLEAGLLVNGGGKHDDVTPQKSSPRVWRRAVAQLREVFLGTRLCPLFSAVPLAVAAEHLHFGRAWVFVFSLIGLAPLAERVSFLSEHIADTAGPTAGGLLNATCGNVPELIIALFALHKEKLEILKWSLLGSILSNLLLVLGSSLLLGGLANAGKEHPFDRRQADVSIGLLMLGVLCHILPVLSKYTISTGHGLSSSVSILELSRLSAVIMLLAYFGGLIFQLKTHRQIFEQEEDRSESSSRSSDDDAADNTVMGFASAVIWLVGMAAVIAMLSNYVITTIEEASESLGIPVRFVSIILLPIVGNAAEHAGAVIFAFKNKIDITLGIALGSATQISLLVIPVILIVSWVNGIPMDLNLNLVETGSLVMTVFTTAFTLQDDKWHYLKGFNLTLCYVVIAVCFFTTKALPTNNNWSPDLQMWVDLLNTPVSQALPTPDEFADASQLHLWSSASPTPRPRALFQPPPTQSLYPPPYQYSPYPYPPPSVHGSSDKNAPPPYTYHPPPPYCYPPYSYPPPPTGGSSGGTAPQPYPYPPHSAYPYPPPQPIHSGAGDNSGGGENTSHTTQAPPKTKK